MIPTNRRSTTTVRLLLCIIAAVFSSISDAASTTLNLKGSIIRRWWRPGEEESAAAMTNTFTGTFGDDGWSVGLLDLLHPEITVQASGDHNSFYMVEDFASLSIKRSSINGGVALATKGPIPRSVKYPQLTLLWALWGSANYFNTTNRLNRDGKVPLLVSLDCEYLSLRNLSLPGTIELGPNGLLRYVCMNDGYMRCWDRQLDYALFPPQQTPVPAPFQHGFTNYVLQVISHSKVRNISVPAHALFDEYTLSDNSNPMLFRRQQINIRVEDIQPGIGNAFNIPSINGSVLLVDQRFSETHSKHPLYHFQVVTNRWLSETEAMTTAEFKDSRERSQKR